MKKSEFTDILISEIESLQIEHLLECYDITSSVHKLVEEMTKDNHLEWEPEDGD